jgi:hypothetical protein
MSSAIKVSKECLEWIKRFPLRPIRDEEMLDAASDVFSDLVLKGARKA